MLFHHIPTVNPPYLGQLTDLLNGAGAQVLATLDGKVCPTTLRWALVHSTDTGQEAKYPLLDLLILFKQGRSRCRREPQISGKPVCWKAGTKDIIDNFATLKTYVESHTPIQLSQLDPNGWIKPRQILAAIDILCLAYRITHNDTEFAKENGLSDQLLSLCSFKARQTENGQWWMKGLRVDSLDNLASKLSAEKVSEATILEIRERLLEAREATKALEAIVKLQELVKREMLAR